MTLAELVNRAARATREEKMRAERLILGVFTAALGIFPFAANAQDANGEEVLILAKHLDKVENPNQLGQVWKDVVNTPLGKTIAEAATTFYGCPGCGTAIIKFINANIANQSDQGEAHVGVIQAPVGYTVCRARVENDVSITCNGTFNGSIRTADDSASGGFDGLHYYMVVPKPAGIAPGRCWVEGTVVVEFIKATPGNRQRSKCMPSGTVAFHQGK